MGERTFNPLQIMHRTLTKTQTAPVSNAKPIPRLLELTARQIALAENWFRDPQATIAAQFCERVRIDWDNIWLSWKDTSRNRAELGAFIEQVLLGRASLVLMTNSCDRSELKYKLDQYARSCESRWEFAITLRDIGEAETQSAIQRHDQNLRYAANPVD